MQEQIIRINYPLIPTRARGPVETIQFEQETNTLSGAYLDYSLACVCGYSAIVLHFFPDQTPYQVKVGDDFENLKIWAPTQNRNLGRELVKRFLDLDEDGSAYNLIKIIAQEIGENVPLLKPVYKFELK